MLKSKRIAIVADWLIDFGWAELVISHLLEIYPEADIYTSVCYMDHPMLEWRRIYTSWLQKIPFLNRRHKLAGILRPFAFRSFDLSEYDVIICSSSAESKQVAVRRGNHLKRKKRDAEVIIGIKKQVIFCYCHTPIRYYWSHHEQYIHMLELGFLNPLLRYFFRKLVHYLRKIDIEGAVHIDYFIANSRTTQERIWKYYHRRSHVIYPGVLLSRNIEWEAKRSQFIHAPTYYISVGRCIPYKRFDLLVDAFNASGQNLILCTTTDTPTYRALRSRSRSNIEWKFAISDTEKNRLLGDATAFLFASEEDFWLVPVEAMAVGTPVIAYGKWWATETIIDGETWVLFTPQTSEALNLAIRRFERMKFDHDAIQKHAENFSKERFQSNISQFIEYNV